ncbi:Nudix hydrolase 9-like protein [Drosera capensis]
MDGDGGGGGFRLLLSCPTGLSLSQVSVIFDESYDRIPHPDVDLENSIAEIWDQRLRRNPSLYNGKKFRYAGHIWHTGSDASENVPRVSLLLGLTEYRTFVGTNLSPSWEKFLVPSEDEPMRCKHSSNPLGNGAVVETSDKKILVLKRSNNVGEFPGHFVFPGGHPEPHEVGIRSHKDSVDRDTSNKKVSQEMFDSIIREVVEEIGVPVNSLNDPVFIGISRRELNVRPTAFFFIECSLHSKDIQELYCSAQDGFESTQLYAVSLDELESMAHKMPGCHEGGFAMYKLMVDD